MLKLPHQTTVHPHLQLLCQDLLKLLGSPKTPGGWDVCPLFLGVQHPTPSNTRTFPTKTMVSWVPGMDGWMDGCKVHGSSPFLSSTPNDFRHLFFGEKIFSSKTFHPSRTCKCLARSFIASSLTFKKREKLLINGVSWFP